MSWIWSLIVGAIIGVQSLNKVVQWDGLQIS